MLEPLEDQIHVISDQVLLHEKASWAKQQYRSGIVQDLPVGRIAYLLKEELQLVLVATASFHYITWGLKSTRRFYSTAILYSILTRWRPVILSRSNRSIIQNQFNSKRHQIHCKEDISSNMIYDASMDVPGGVGALLLFKCQIILKGFLSTRRRGIWCSTIITDQFPDFLS